MNGSDLQVVQFSAGEEEYASLSEDWYREPFAGRQQLNSPLLPITSWKIPISEAPCYICPATAWRNPIKRQ